MTTWNADEIRAWTANQLRIQEEARTVPDTTHPYGPCVVCWATTVRTLRGVCRPCSAKERKGR